MNCPSSVMTVWLFLSNAEAERINRIAKTIIYGSHKQRVSALKCKRQIDVKYNVVSKWNTELIMKCITYQWHWH